MRQIPVTLLLLGVVGLALSSCAKPPPPKVAVAPPPPPPPPPPPHAARPVASHAIAASKWSFHPADCSATAAGGALSLDVTVSARQLSLVLRTSPRSALKAGGAVPIVFAGTGGSWTASGQVTARHRVTATQTMSSDAASQLLVLLAGGLIKPGGAGVVLPRLRVPNAGEPGKTWFECVRHRLPP